MNKTFIKSLFLGVFLAFAVQPAPIQANNQPNEAPSFIDNGLNFAGNSVALCGLAYGGCHGIRALAYWLKSNCVEPEEYANRLSKEGRESRNISLKALGVAFIARNLAQVKFSALIYHVDLTPFIMIIFKSLFSSK